MYEDGWYSLVSEIPNRSASAGNSNRGHQRRASLLQQPNGTSHAVEAVEALENVYEDIEEAREPPEASVLRRAASYSDFYRVVRAQLHKDSSKRRKKTTKKDRSWEALLLNDKANTVRNEFEEGLSADVSQNDLLEASQQEYTLYRDQLALTERHLDGLIDDANTTLKLLTSLSDAFQSVENQTSSFQAQCEDLLGEQRRLEKLAHDVGTDLHYYEYMDDVTRRLNAPGAGRMVDDETFGDMIASIDACIVFMKSHENYRDAETYDARYNALLTKALHLLDHGFTGRLEKISTDIGRQVSVNHSESARHALAYGRFEELMLNSYHLIPNIHRIARKAYDQYGRPADKPTETTPIYANSASNIFHAWLTTRDRDLKPLTQGDIESLQKEVKSLSVETACRNFIKQTFERVYNEDGLFLKIFDIEPLWSKSEGSVYQVLKGINTTMAHPGHLTPLANNLQSVLQTSELQTTCNIVGWLASEYSMPDNEDDESPFQAKSREYAARLLIENMWPFTDSAFEAEITKTITRAVAPDSALTIGPVEGGVSSSNAFPLVKRAMELLVMFDQSMPKDRSAQNSTVVFKIVQETIQVLQRAETRIKAIQTDTDPDLFMVKNLLIIKNELVSLEIGDIRSQTAAMQHFSQIWDALSPQNWVGFFGNMLGGSLFSRGGPPTVTARTMTVEDMNEQLDDILRQSIYGFTKRWGAVVNDSRARKTGVKPIAKVEAQLETMLETAFSNQQEVKAKLMEAIELNARAQNDVKDGKQGAKRY